MARTRKTKSSSVKVNFKGVESRKTPKEGDYIVEVLEAKSGESSAGNDQIEFVLEIAKGEYKGVKLWFYCPLQENSLWKLHAFLTALGEDVPEDEMDIDLSDLVGKQAVAVVTHETYNGKKRAKMTDFDSLENYTGDAGDGDEDEDDKKSSKKSSKKDKEEKEEKSSKKSKKDDGDKKSKKDKKPKKVSRDDVEDMDEDELAELVKAHSLDVKLKGKLKKDRAAVIDALEDEDLLED